METRTITSRTRSLGFGWRNDVEQRNGSLAVKRVTAFDVTGGLATVEREAENARRCNSGNDWSYALFLGGKLIIGVEDLFPTCDCLQKADAWHDGEDDTPGIPDRYGPPANPYVFCQHPLRKGWAEPTWENIVNALRRGETITVRLAD